MVVGADATLILRDSQIRSHGTSGMTHAIRCTTCTAEIERSHLIAQGAAATTFFADEGASLTLRQTQVSASADSSAAAVTLFGGTTTGVGARVVGSSLAAASSAADAKGLYTSGRAVLTFRESTLEATGSSAGHGLYLLGAASGGSSVDFHGGGARASTNAVVLEHINARFAFAQLEGLIFNGTGALISYYGVYDDAFGGRTCP